MRITQQLTQQFQINPAQSAAVIALIDAGNTIPFIARYRKEKTGGMDDQTLRAFSDQLQTLRNMEAKRQDVRAKIEEQGKLTSLIVKALDQAKTLTEIDDIYRPFKKSKWTRAMIAVEKGLQGLADQIFAQENRRINVMELAQSYVDTDKGVATVEEALDGAKDIIAAEVASNATYRKQIRHFAERDGYIAVSGVKKKDVQDSVYSMYAEYDEPVHKMPPHRILAVNRGEKEGYLKVKLDMDETQALGIIYRHVIKKNAPTAKYVAEAVQDGYSRLIFPSIEREVRAALTEQAMDNATSVFALNLKNLLMQPPLKSTVVMGLDPAYRTGCKIAVVDGTGKVLDTTVVYPTPPQNKTAEAKKVLSAMIRKHRVQTVAIGNGTASRESEEFIAGMTREIDGLSYMVVNEAGASVYSASKLAAEEFPQFDLTLRSAISIARRLQDPLAELVKIDPQSIGVGQYQHDIAKKKLDGALEGVVEGCVNSVGVDLNTASEKLLSFIAGIGSTVARNIVEFRETQGKFTSRRQLLKVPKLGPKAYEQCAGFLRIAGGRQPLDATGVHPESYPAATLLLKECGYSNVTLGSNALASLPDQVQARGYAAVAQQIGIGQPTLKDIVDELVRPGRDPRDDLPAPMLRKDVMDMDSLTEGMELQGTVRNVVDFGAFVDIGVHQDGLVHISKLCNRYIKHPNEVVKVGDIVTVWVVSVDKARKRIALTMVQDR